MYLKELAEINRMGSGKRLRNAQNERLQETISLRAAVVENL